MNLSDVAAMGATPRAALLSLVMPGTLEVNVVDGILDGVLALAAWQDRLGEQLYWGVWTIGPWDLHPLSLLFVLSGSLMISTIRIPKV